MTTDAFERLPNYLERLPIEDPAHEKAVKEFFAKVAKRRPATYKAVTDRIPVLSIHQMRHRLRREIPSGDEIDIEVIGRFVDSPR